MLLCRLWLQLTSTAQDGSSCILDILASHRPSFLDSLWSRNTWVCTDMEVNGKITISLRPQVGNYSYWWFDLFYLLGAKTGKYGLADQNEDGEVLVAAGNICINLLQGVFSGKCLCLKSMTETNDMKAWRAVLAHSLFLSVPQQLLTQPECHRN